MFSDKGTGRSSTKDYTLDDKKKICYPCLIWNTGSYNSMAHTIVPSLNNILGTQINTMPSCPHISEQGALQAFTSDNTNHNKPN